MRFALAAEGSRGDVQPLVGLAARLVLAHLPRPAPLIDESEEREIADPPGESNFRKSVG